MNYRIEQLKEGDWRRLREVRLRSLADMPDAFGSTLEREEAFSDEEWMRRVAREDAATFVAVTDDGREIGLVTMAPYGDDVGLFGMWVDPDFRKEGVGGLLIDHGVHWAREGGFANVILDVGDHNHAAIALYQSRGFNLTGQTSTLPAPREHISEHQRLLELTDEGG